MKRFISTGLLAAVTLAAFPLVGFAQGTITEPTPVSITSVDGFFTILEDILQILYTLFFIVAVIMFLYAAFLYLTAGGSEDKTGKAKQILIYGVIAIVVALLAWSIPAIVASILGA